VKDQELGPAEKTTAGKKKEIAGYGPRDRKVGWTAKLLLIQRTSGLERAPGKIGIKGREKMKSQ